MILKDTLFKIYLSLSTLSFLGRAVICQFAFLSVSNNSEYLLPSGS